LVTNKDLGTHLKIFKQIMGNQKGGLEGLELIFVTKQYAKNIRNGTTFYKKAIYAITQLITKKKIEDIMQEKVFYNETFKNAKNSTLTPNTTCLNNNIQTYGQIVEEYEKMQNKQYHNRHIANVYIQITQKDIQNRSDNQIYHTTSKTFIKFEEFSHKMVYQELIRLRYREHHSKSKWEQRFPSNTIDWNKIWPTLLNPVTTEDNKTITWEQIHLNEYTTYSYNKWHNAQQECPFCNQIPTNQFHITIECTALKILWLELENHLLHIHPTAITDFEKVFGLIANKPSIILRNWMTFLLRQCIVEQENIAYHNKKGQGNIPEIKLKYNQMVKTEVWKKYNIYRNLGRTQYFENVFAVNNYLIVWEQEQWQILTIYQI